MKKPWVRWVLIGLGILGVVLFFQGCYMFFEPIKIDHSVGCIKGGRCDSSGPEPLGLIVSALGILLLLVWGILRAALRKR